MEQENTYSAELIAEIQQKVQACMQCGTCSGSCASSFAMDLTPRQLWRLVQLGETEEILDSKTFYLCSACYFCTLRCPRGLQLTEAMGGLKRLAVARGIKRHQQSANFYQAVMDTVQRYGRMREMESISRYFLSMKNPFFPLGYTSMGLKLLSKGKMAIQLPQLLPVKDEEGKVKYFEGRFDRLFRKVEELEERS